MKQKSYLNEEITMVLNRYWLPVAWKTPAQAITSLCPEKNQEPTNFVLDVISDDRGGIVNVNRYSWDEWVKLPVEARHLPLMTKYGAIRCPTLIVHTNYEDNPFRADSFSKKAIWKRDGGVCQVSGRKLSKDEGNMGHDQAASNGGKWSFDNIVLMDKRLNLLQGTKTFAEMGWNLIKQPKAPAPVPASFKIKDAKTEEQKNFIIG